MPQLKNKGAHKDIVIIKSKVFNIQVWFVWFWFDFDLIFLFFLTRVELEFIIKLDNLFKLFLFVFQTNLSLFTSYSINLFILYIK